jgi:hypothetical protein
MFKKGDIVVCIDTSSRIDNSKLSRNLLPLNIGEKYTINEVLNELSITLEGKTNFGAFLSNRFMLLTEYRR